MALGDLKFGSTRVLFNPTGSDSQPVNRAKPGSPVPVAVGGFSVNSGYVFGGGNYIRIPDMWGVSTFAYVVEGRFFYNGSAPGGASGILTIFHVPAGSVGGQIKLYTDNGVLKTNIGGVVRSTAFTPVSGSSYHYCVERDTGGTTRVYVDGVLKNTFADASDYDYTGDVYLGANSAGGEKMTVEVTVFRVTTFVDRYAGAFTPPGLPYPDYYRTLVGTVKDETGTLANFFVFVLDAFSGEFVSQGNSNNPSTGSYAVKVYFPSEYFVVIAHNKYFTDPGPHYNHRVIRVNA